jgi:hypothetical protein
MRINQNFIIIFVFGVLCAIERQGEPAPLGNRDECGYAFLESCYDEETCYPAGWLSDGQCDPQLGCYQDDGMDCDGGDGGLYIEDCSICESMENDMNCYDLLGQFINCFGCYYVYDCAYDCMGDAVEDQCGVCEGDGPEAGFDCEGNCMIGEDCNGDCGGFAEPDECGVCDGNGIAEGECDCYGSVIDECGICGGDGNWCSAPVAESAEYTLVEDTMIAIYLSDHASDTDGDALTFTLASDATSGSVVLDGPLATYVPDAHYHGEDSFTFFASDETQNSNEATITLIILPAADDDCAAEYNQGFEDGFLDGSLTGDANGDGVLNVVDIVFFINIILNEE